MRFLAKGFSPQAPPIILALRLWWVQSASRQNVANSAIGMWEVGTIPVRLDQEVDPAPFNPGTGVEAALGDAVSARDHVFGMVDQKTRHLRVIEVGIHAVGVIHSHAGDKFDAVVVRPRSDDMEYVGALAVEFGDDGGCGVGRFGKSRTVDFADPRAVHGDICIANAPDVGADVEESQGLFYPGFEVGARMPRSGFVNALAVIIVDDAVPGHVHRFKAMVGTRRIKRLGPSRGIPT